MLFCLHLCILLVKVSQLWSDICVSWLGQRFDDSDEDISVFTKRGGKQKRGKSPFDLDTDEDDDLDLFSKRGGKQKQNFREERVGKKKNKTRRGSTLYGSDDDDIEEMRKKHRKHHDRGGLLFK